MVLYSERVTGWNSAFEDDIQARTTSRETRQLLKDLSAACTMATRNRAAARAAWSAVAGPCTTEYGPCVAGKRKIVRMLRTARAASSHPIRPGVIEVSRVIISNCMLLDDGTKGLCRPRCFRGPFLLLRRKVAIPFALVACTGVHICGGRIGARFWR
jgi:hypothetical protein